MAVWVGTGVGGAVIMNGKIHSGRNRNAGEIGHTQIDFRRAAPGKLDGTLEGTAAKVGIAAYLRRRIDRGDRTELEKAVSKKDVRLKGSQLREAWEEGDELARRALARSARAVGITMANVWNILSPDLFVLGGGVATDVGARLPRGGPQVGGRLRVHAGPRAGSGSSPRASATTPGCSGRPFTRATESR